MYNTCVLGSFTGFSVESTFSSDAFLLSLSGMSSLPLSSTSTASAESATSVIDGKANSFDPNGLGVLAVRPPRKAGVIRFLPSFRLLTELPF